MNTNDFIAPSWSWASVNYPVYMPMASGLLRDGAFRFVAKVIEVCTTPASDDPMGKINKGYLRIYGPLRNSPPPRAAKDDTGNPHSYCQHTDWNTWYDDEPYFGTHQPCHATLHLILAYGHFNSCGESEITEAVYGILVSPTDERKEEYRRVGMFCNQWNRRTPQEAASDSLFDDLDPENVAHKTIVIV